MGLKMGDSDQAELMKDPKMQSFISRASQLEQLNSVMQELTSKCWDTCIADTRITSELSAKSEKCVENCVERFVDANKVIVEHKQQSPWRLRNVTTLKFC